MKIKLISFLLLFSLSFSCKEVQQADGNYLVRETDIQFYDSGKFSDIVEDFEIIPLETNDDCLISNIDVAKKREGRYYLRTQNRLYAFDEAGKFLMKVGNIGQGPGEYGAFSDFDADRENIYILTVNGKILVYDGNNGKFKKEIDISHHQFTFGYMRCIDNGFLLVHGNETKAGDGLIYMDKEGNVVLTAMPLHSGNVPRRSLHWLKWKTDCFIYHLGVSNDLYRFNAATNEFTPLLVSNEEGLLTAKDVLELDGDRHREMMDKEIMDMADSEKQFVWGRTKGNNLFYDVYNKESRKVLRFNVFKTQDDLFFSANENEMLHLMYLLKCSSDDDYFITITDANLLKEKMAEKGMLSTAPYDKLKDIPDDSNPAIVRLKFR